MAPIKKTKIIKNPPSKRFCYAPMKVNNALKAIKAGMSILKASKMFGVPRSTLNNKVKGRAPEASGRSGPQSVLGNETEKDLENWVLELSRTGFPITKEQLLDSVQKIIEDANMETPFKDSRPGWKWYLSFIKRHSVIKDKKAEFLDKKANLDENKVRNWFSEVMKLVGGQTSVLENPHSIYNADELTFLSTTKGLVVPPKNINCVSDKEYVTTFLMLNAAGEVAPPLTIFKYQRLPKYIYKSAPDNWGIGISDSGRMTNKTFFEYITNVFYPYLVENKAVFPVIIFIDANKCHITLHLSKFCHEKNIIMVAFYPNTADILQPLNVGFLEPFRERWNLINRKWRYEHNLEDISKYNFCNALKEIIYDNSILEEIKSNFERCAIFPFNPDNLDYSSFAGVKKSITTSPSSKSHEMSHLKYLESLIEPSLLLLFKDTKKKKMDWQGERSASMLYDVWLKTTNLNETNESLFDTQTSNTHHRKKRKIEKLSTQEEIPEQQQNSSEAKVNNKNLNSIREKTKNKKAKQAAEKSGSKRGRKKLEPNNERKNLKLTNGEGESLKIKQEKDTSEAKCVREKLEMKRRRKPEASDERKNSTGEREKENSENEQEYENSEEEPENESSESEPEMENWEGQQANENAVNVLKREKNEVNGNIKRDKVPETEDDWSCIICKESWFVEYQHGKCFKWIECAKCNKQFHFKCLPVQHIQKFKLNLTNLIDEDFVCMECMKINEDNELN